jgi:DUF2911 family protein
MKRIALAAALVIAFPIAAAAQQQPPPVPLRMAASSYASVEVHLNQRPIGGRFFEEDASLTGPSRIAISYGQPHARGRRVEGGLIPTDTVWRFGANTATTLHTDLDLNLGGLRVPRGDYSLFILHTGDVWRLIVNTQTGQWGTDYDERQDLGRVNLQAETLPAPRESLTVYLVPQSPQPGTGYAETRGVLRIEWGRTALSTGWSVYR